MQSSTLPQAISLLVGLLVFTVAHFIISLITDTRKISLEERLQNTREHEIREILKEKTYSDTRYGRFHKVYIGPYISRYPNVFNQITKLLGINIDALEQQIRDARLEKTFTAEEVVSMKLLGGLGMIIFILLSLSFNFNMPLALIAVLCYLFGVFMPQKMIDKNIKERKERIENDLPDFLDLVKSVTESGLGIQEALNKVSARTRGPLAEEFRAVMIETRANGGQWRLAMENMAFRNNIENLSDVVSDILIAYEKGTSITDTLKKEADMMRQIRNSRIQEKARGLSVKLIVPMAIFNFLPLLALMIGPMLIELGSSLG